MILIILSRVHIGKVGKISSGKIMLAYNIEIQYTQISANDVACDCCDNCTVPTTTPCIACASGTFLNGSTNLCDDCSLGHL